MPIMVHQSNGWTSLVQMRGFPHHRIEAHIQDLQGTPRVTELRVLLTESATPGAITDHMLRSLDLRTLAKWSNDVAQPELHQDLLETARDIMRTKPPMKRVTVQEVAELWKAAHEAERKDPRTQVVNALARQGIRISERTISRRIADAKDLGLIPQDWR